MTELRQRATGILELAGIETPVVGVYDAPHTLPFAPLVLARRCIFSSYENWQKGHCVLVNRESEGCRGAVYWLCGIEATSKEKMRHFYSQRKGLKATAELMEHWLEDHPPHKPQESHLIVGPLKEGQDRYLKTITLYVNPDQLSLLLTGCEYENGPADAQPIISSFGSGCGQLAALFKDLNVPQAIIGSTDILMREHLPPEVMALTVTKPMFEQLCSFGENSSLFRPFWSTLRNKRSEQAVNGFGENPEQKYTEKI